MKKKLIILISSVLLIAMSITTFTACDGKENNNNNNGQNAPAITLTEDMTKEELLAVLPQINSVSVKCHYFDVVEECHVIKEWLLIKDKGYLRKWTYEDGTVEIRVDYAEEDKVTGLFKETSIVYNPQIGEGEKYIYTSAYRTNMEAFFKLDGFIEDTYGKIAYSFKDGEEWHIENGKLIIGVGEDEQVFSDINAVEIDFAYYLALDLPITEFNMDEDM